MSLTLAYAFEPFESGTVFSHPLFRIANILHNHVTLDPLSINQTEVFGYVAQLFRSSIYFAVDFKF